MNRLAFTKADTAKFISHLDLMRTFQRSFLRAGIRIFSFSEQASHYGG